VNTDRNGHSALLIDKKYSSRLAWFLSQTITWFADRKTVMCSGKSLACQLLLVRAVILKDFEDG